MAAGGGGRVDSDMMSHLACDIMLSTTLRRLPTLLQRRLIHTTQRTCPSCSQPLPSPLPVCNKCWHISRLPRDMKFHDIFGLPYEPNPFVIDVSLLKERFRNTQAICHPDSWASKGSVRPVLVPPTSVSLKTCSCSRTSKTLLRLFLPV